MGFEYSHWEDVETREPVYRGTSRRVMVGGEDGAAPVLVDEWELSHVETSYSKRWIYREDVFGK